ncbi:MAG: hypothetical protein K6G51_01630 [Sphaerochaetaceae bacterium]|nr:hypothetical protein [Sphaerochaetaceae bacterium]
MKKEEWESLCSNCGLCCHEKVVSEDMLLIDLSNPCEFYDSENKCCSVYEERFKKCHRCKKVNLFRAMFASYLPSICGYVRWAKEHHVRLCKEKECVLGNGVFDFVDD